MAKDPIRELAVKVARILMEVPFEQREFILQTLAKIVEADAFVPGILERFAGTADDAP